MFLSSQHFHVLFSLLHLSCKLLWGGKWAPHTLLPPSPHPCIPLLRRGLRHLAHFSCKYGRPNNCFGDKNVWSTKQNVHLSVLARASCRSLLASGSANSARRKLCRGLPGAPSSSKDLEAQKILQLCYCHCSLWLSLLVMTFEPPGGWESKERS